MSNRIAFPCLVLALAWGGQPTLLGAQAISTRCDEKTVERLAAAATALTTTTRLTSNAGIAPALLSGAGNKQVRIKTGSRDDIIGRSVGLVALLVEVQRDAGRQSEIARIQAACGRVEDAVRSYGRVLNRKLSGSGRGGYVEPVDPDKLLSLAFMHHSGSRPDSAAYYVDAARRQPIGVPRAVRIDAPDLTPLRIGRAVSVAAMYRDIGMLDSAEVVLERGLPTGINSGQRVHVAAIHESLIRLYHMEGRLSLIGELLDSVMRSDAALAAQLADSSGDGALARRFATRALVGRASDAPDNATVGELFHILGRPDSSRAYYLRAVDDARGRMHSSPTSAGYRELARAELGAGLADAAGASLDSAFAIEVRTGTPTVETLAGVAHYLHRVRDEPALAAASLYYEAASLRARAMSDDEARMSAGERLADIYGDWVLALRAREGELGVEGALLSSLAAAERARSQALLALLRTFGVDRNAGSTIGGTPPRLGMDLAPEARRLSTVGTQMNASLSYMLTRDTLLIWSVNRLGGITLTSTAISRDSIATLVAAAIAELGLAADSTRGFKAIEQSGPTPPSGRASRASRRPPNRTALAQLSELLIPEGLADQVAAGEELVIVPHGSLTRVPFAVLSLRDSSLLGARNALRYTPSLTMLLTAQGRPTLRTRAGVRVPSALVVADPAMPTVVLSERERLPLSPLSGAREEGQWVAARLGASLLTGADASETRVRDLVRRAPLVHLATHGYGFTAGVRARDSFVALAAGNGHNGVLTVGEILDTQGLTFSADLVVLSACQTGAGASTLGEGVLGLHRAFLAKGARSVLASLWSVSDAATLLLMKQFYTHWLDDADTPTKAEALRRAQEDVRKTPGFEHPRYWAAFQLVGAS